MVGGISTTSLLTDFFADDRSFHKSYRKALVTVCVFKLYGFALESAAHNSIMSRSNIDDLLNMKPTETPANSSPAVH